MNLINRLGTAAMLAGVCALGLPTASVLAIPAAVAATEPDATGEAYKRLAEQTGPSLVAVKYILKFEGGGQFANMMGGDDGRETEMTGLMIEPTGLVLCSNTKMGGFAAMMGMYGGGGVNANPTDIKVLVGEDTEGLKARLVARDSDLDLCWVQIEDEKAHGRTFQYVDLKSSTTAAVGDRILTVQRKGKFFDRALVVDDGRIGGTARKPRSLLIPSGTAADLGMPVFSMDGKLLGIGVIQLPSREDMEGGDTGGMFEGFGGGGPVILPAADVAKATERSKTILQSGDKKGESGSGESGKTE